MGLVFVSHLVTSDEGTLHPVTSKIAVYRPIWTGMGNPGVDESFYI
jgi:hypothetical protein